MKGNRSFRMYIWKSILPPLTKYSCMTQQEIQQQIAAIRQASAEARKTPETARQFLIDAGIIKKEEAEKPVKLETKSKK